MEASLVGTRARQLLLIEVEARVRPRRGHDTEHIFQTAFVAMNSNGTLSPAEDASLRLGARNDVHLDALGDQAAVQMWANGAGSARDEDSHVWFPVIFQ